MILFYNSYQEEDYESKQQPVEASATDHRSLRANLMFVYLWAELIQQIV
jgi:hypothetical protein